MTPEKTRFVNVDELMRGLGLHQVAHFYGVQLPELHRTTAETRTRCFLNCGKAKETGDRVLAIQEGDPATRWHCHAYGCGKGGNLVGLCDLMKGGQDCGGKPRGERFKEIARDLQAMAGGDVRSETPAPAPQARISTAEEPKVNLPLHQSQNERARGLTELDVKFIRDPASMPPAASAYVRRRPFLSPEAMMDWRVGYLPRNTGGDASGGTMRGKIVYSYHSAEGNLLTWFGRDPEFEAKHRQWEASDRSGKEPDKFHFVKGFHRGIELFGQERLRGPEASERLKGVGLPVVEGPNDVIRLSALGVPAVALCSNTISREQAARVAELAYRVRCDVAVLLLDCDSEGEKGMKQALGYLSQLMPVRLAWASTMHGGTFRGRQPESLSEEEWTRIRLFLTREGIPFFPVDIERPAAEPEKAPPSQDPSEWDYL